jgi:hypothetical protein
MTVFGVLILAAGLTLAAVAAVLVVDDLRARAWEGRNARRWEDEL